MWSSSQITTRQSVTASICDDVIQILGPTQIIRLDRRKLGTEINPCGSVENITQCKSCVKH